MDSTNWQATDPAVHAICLRIATGCVGVIESLLRQEEVNEALREFYIVARAEVDKPSTRPEV